MIKKLILLIYLFVFTFTFSQQAKVDSLKNVLKDTPDKTTRMEILKELCKKSSEINKLEESQVYYEELIRIAQAKNDEKTLVFGYQLLLREHEKNRDSVKALQYFYKSHKINLKNKDSLNIAKDYVGLGGIYNKFQIYIKAEKSYLKALDICLNNDFEYAGKVYSNLAIVYQNLNKFDTSTKHAIKANEIALKTADIPLEVGSLGIIGGNYTWLRNFQKAEEYHLKAVSIAEKNNLGIELINSYRGIALNASRALKYEQAIHYNFKALEMAEKYGDKIYILDILSNIGSTYSRMEKIDEALKIYNKASGIAKELKTQIGINTINVNVAYLKIEQLKYTEAEKMLLKLLKDTVNKENISDAIINSSLLQLAIIKEKTKKFDESLNYYKKYKDFSDGLKQQNQLLQVAEIETKYQTEKKEKENLALKKKTAEQELAVQQATNLNQRYGFIALTLLLGIIGLFYYSKNRRRKLRDEHIINIAKTKQKEHEKIGADLHSTKAKDLEKIASTLEQKGEAVIASSVREVKDSIRLLSHELFQIPFSQQEFDDQIINLLFEYNSDSLKITHEGIHTTRWGQVDNTIKRNLYLIISEAISNVKNHSQASAANIKFQRTNKNIDVIITDNGIGFTEENLKNGHGIGNMRMRVNEIKGSIRFDAVKDKGSKIGIFITAF